MNRVRRASLYIRSGRACQAGVLHADSSKAITEFERSGDRD